MYCTNLLYTEISFYAQCNVTKIADVMKLVLPKQVPSWEVFSSVVLCPLRVQMMGSVVVSVCALILKVTKSNQGCSIVAYKYACYC